MMNRSNYLSYGGSLDADNIDQTGTLQFLRSLGFGNGDLHQARSALEFHRDYEFTFNAIGSNYCDFCFDRIMGGEYERLRDGRDRCTKCSRTVLASHEQFVEEFQRVCRNMELAFGITLETVSTVKMVNAREIAKNTSETFTPTAGIDARVLGYAEESNKGPALYIENGSPRIAAISTMAHELTHIWQHSTWDKKKILTKYGAKYELLIYEGMAMWVQIQYLLYIREFEYAMRQYAFTLLREDEYGLGFKVFLDKYQLQFDGDVGRESPFHNPFPL